MRIIVTGGRDYTDREHIFNTLDIMHRGVLITHVVHGGCRGVDKIVDEWAVLNRIQVTEYPANWEKYGLSAGPRRNEFMCKSESECPDTYLIAFPGGRGTKHCESMAYKYNIPTYRVYVREEEI